VRKPKDELVSTANSNTFLRCKQSRVQISYLFHPTYAHKTHHLCYAPSDAERGVINYASVRGEHTTKRPGYAASGGESGTETGTSDMCGVSLA
jgi:hypothetical protein